jgi:hypothetical protein
MSGKATNSAEQGGRWYLSPAEFSRRSGLSLATVHRYLKGGKIPFRQPGGPCTRILIPVDALESASAGAIDAGPDLIASQGMDSSLVPAERPAPLPGPKPKWTSLGGDHP